MEGADIIEHFQVLVCQFLDEIIVVNHEEVIFDSTRFEVFTVVTSGV